MRRVFNFLLWTSATLLVAILLSPYWLGWTLPAIARGFRTTFASYSRIGYSRFVLEKVVVQRRTVTVQAARAEADTPWLWALRHVLHHDHLILVDDWVVQVHPSGGPRGMDEPEGWRPLQAHLTRIVGGLETWLRLASIGRGKVGWPRNELNLEHAVWNQRKLKVDRLAWRGYEANVDLLFDRGPESWQLRAQGLRPALTLTAQNTGAELKGILTAAHQNAPFVLDFGEAGWTPPKAEISAENWVMDGAVLRMSEYQNLRGSAHANWDHEHFQVSANVHGEPAAGTRFPPLQVVVRANGDRERYAIDQVDVIAPGVQAHLNRPLAGSFLTDTLSALPPAEFAFAVHLPSVPDLKADGDLTGVVKVNPQGRGWPQLDFLGHGTRLAFSQAKIPVLNVAVHLNWPQVTLERADVGDEKGTGLHLAGEANFVTKELAAFRADGTLDPALFQPFLPAKFSFSGGKIALIAHGPFASLSHQGTVELDQLQVHELKPAALQLWWRGEGAKIAEGTVGIQIGTTELIAGGAGDAHSVSLQKLVWRQAGKDRLTLQNSAIVQWSKAIQVENFNLKGPAGELRVNGRWGETGELEFFAHGIEAPWWQDLVPATPFNWSIENLNLRAKWQNGPVDFESSGQVRVTVEDRAPIEVALDAKTTDAEVSIRSLRVSEAQTELANFSGKIPLQIFVGTHPHWALERKAALTLKGHVNPEAPEWTELARRAGISLLRPEVELAFSGSLDRPSGTLHFAAEEMQLDSRYGRKSWPKIENVSTLLTASGDRLTLTEGGMKVAGQQIEFSGGLPTNDKTWRRLASSPWSVLWNEAEFSVRIKDADLVDLAPFASPLLLPQGHLDADISVSGREPWKGFLHLRDLATRPISSLGRLRDIHADLSFENRTVKFNDFELSFGERPVKISGSVVVPSEGAPKIDLEAIGTDLPFVREAGLLVRGNIKLNLASAARKSLRPIIRGEIELTDGLFVSDVRSLIPRGGSSPTLRPPYFAIEAEPFNTWRLDVNVRGDHFLRARTTIFTGGTSMNFHLLGTLGEPQALGELRLSDGQVIFPFAQFALNDATVRLTQENPYDPTLGIFGTSRRYGYDLTMEVTGPASAPVIAFSSNPTLTSEQVLLMVMAGEVPKDEISYSNSQRLSRIGTFFGQSLLGSLGSGRGQDRLTITSGQEVSVTGRETYDVEYALDDRWSLVGEYDQFDDYNAGVKWKILAKHKNPPDEKK